MLQRKSIVARSRLGQADTLDAALCCFLAAAVPLNSAQNIAERGVPAEVRMTTENRPLSPFLTIYRPQSTSVLSILHRICGVIIALGAVLLAWWILAAAAGPASYEAMRSFFASWFGRLLLGVFSYAVVYHLCAGVRHLIWDAAWMLEKEQVNASGWAMFAIVNILFLAVWGVGYACR